jgi:hypothetical protein
MKLLVHICVFIFVSKCYAQKSDFKAISFKKADSIALAFKGEKLTNVPQLSYNLTSNLTTEVEKFRAIFKWITTNIANDYPQYTKNKRKRYKLREDEQQLTEWSILFRKEAFKKLLGDNKATCTGYAYLLKELSKYADLNCKIVNGYAKTSSIDVDQIHAPNHSWNAIELSGKWYLCDPTWASGIQNPKTLRFEFKYNDGFFLTNPEMFAINHHPVDEEWLLFEENKPTYETFLEAPILYGKAYTSFGKHLLPKKMHSNVKKKEAIIFKYKLLQPVNVEDIELLIDTGMKYISVKPKIISVEKNTLTFEHTFKRRGFYDVHMFIKSDVVATYTFKVIK